MLLPLALALVLSQPFSTGGRVTRAGTGLAISGGTVRCTIATNGVPGCMNSIAGQSQSLDGFVHWTELAFFEGNYDLGNSLRADLYASHGVATKAVFPTSNNLGLTITGRRGWGDPDPSVVIASTNWRDGGYLLAVQFPGSTSNAFDVTEVGDLDFGSVIDRLGNSSQEGGRLMDRSGFSGHHALDRDDGYYLAIGGSLGALTGPSSCALEADGGRPVYDAGPWVRQESDGGTCYNYAGGHGDVNVADRYAMQAGFTAEFYNPISGVGARTDHRAFIDWVGAYSQGHGLRFSQFPTPKWFDVSTSLGTFLYGEQPGSLMWDGLKDVTPAIGSQRWYWAENLPDGGAQWAQFAHKAPVYLPPVYVGAALVASTTLGGFVLPTSEVTDVSAIQFYVSASGSGGSTNAGIRASDGTNNCDFNFACNLSTGAKRVTGTGTCQFTWGKTLTWTVTGIGNCATGPTLAGNLTPEALWN